MELLKNKILDQGKCLKDGVLKVDNFINHQIDPKFMQHVALEFVQRFQGVGINKVVTIEASGIAPAIMVGYLLDVPVVFGKKKKPSTMDDSYHTQVYSFTKNTTYDIVISSEYLNPSDKILFIDDFLANGNAAVGILDLVEQSGSTLVGMGFVIEKSFQQGREKLESLGVHVESLARIKDLSNCEIKFED